MQLGFVIDHSRCIGCHACTVACKSENDVPLGSFRTWVKYTERGEFPEVKRSFAVLRCNQCTAAPCVEICPTRALQKRPDGIVDVESDFCIGCKSCMQGCPYDALYINTSSGTAEKCHFCAHRTERGLAPACAVVCPTEAIIPGDFDEPESVVSRMKREFGLEARKTEAGTGPNVFYREAAAEGLRPLETNGSGGYLWSDRIPGVQADAEAFHAAESRAAGRTTYDVPHAPMWGWRVGAYLFTKSLSGGAFLAGLPLILGGVHQALVALSALVFLALTALLLILDLKRPERFALILLHPNWSSWLVKGTYVLIGYGALAFLWWVLALTDNAPGAGEPLTFLLAVPTAVLGALTACYTAFLFAQAKGRVLWMRRLLWLDLVLQAAVGGAALLILLSPLADLGREELYGVSWIGAIAILGLLAMHPSHGKLAPAGREEEYERAHDFLARGLARGPLVHLGRIGWIGAGLAMVLGQSLSPLLPLAGAALALYLLYREEDAFVRAGQAQPIS